MVWWAVPKCNTLIFESIIEQILWNTRIRVNGVYTDEKSQEGDNDISLLHNKYISLIIESCKFEPKSSF